MALSGWRLSSRLRLLHSRLAFQQCNLMHSSLPLSRGGRIRIQDVHDPAKMQKTMNKIMGIENPERKRLAYKPGTQRLTNAAALEAKDFEVVTLDQEKDKPYFGPTPGNTRRAKQLSDVMFLRITEMIYSDSIHPIFQSHSLEITRVQMKPDMRNLDVFWTMTGNELVDREIAETLNGEACWEIRKQIASLQVMGRAPKVRFVGDDSRMRLNHIHHLIEVADKPPDDESLDVEESPSPDSSSNDVEDSARIPSLTFPPDAPTWSDAAETVTPRTTNPFNLNRDKMMALIEAQMGKARNVEKGVEDSMTMASASAAANEGASKSPYQSRAELTRFIRQRKRKMWKKPPRDDYVAFEELEEEDHRLP